MTLVFVDCEAVGPSVSTGYLTEFGAVEYKTRASFHGIVDKKVAEKRRSEYEEIAVPSREWKKMRVTTHDHHPVNDAMGNVEAFERMMEMVKSRR